MSAVAQVAALNHMGVNGVALALLMVLFQLGNDLDPAYTFIALPAAMLAVGAVNGFFAVPCTIVLCPIIFVFMSRLWSVRQGHADLPGHHWP